MQHSQQLRVGVLGPEGDLDVEASSVCKLSFNRNKYLYCLV